MNLRRRHSSHSIMTMTGHIHLTGTPKFVQNFVKKLLQIWLLKDADMY